MRLASSWDADFEKMLPVQCVGVGIRQARFSQEMLDWFSNLFCRNLGRFPPCEQVFSDETGGINPSPRKQAPTAFSSTLHS